MIKHLPLLLLAPAMAAVGLAATDEPSTGDLDSFNTLRDPTVLSSQLSLGLEYWDQDYGAFRSKQVLSGEYAFGGGGQRDWVVSAELPFLLDEPGDTAGDQTGGVGDFKLGAGHVFDGIGRFRWGLGLAVGFDTASEDQFGDGALKLSPQWGAGYRFRPDFELTAKVQYNGSVWEDDGRSEVNSLELRLALLKTWPHYWYSLAGYGSLWDFERDDIYSGAFKAEVGKAFGTRQEWVAYLSTEVPAVNAGPNDFTVKLGIGYIFK
jgi:hypothetical protein